MPHLRRMALGIWLVFLGTYGLTGGGRFFTVDEVTAYQMTRYFSWWDGRPVAPSIVTREGTDGRQWGFNQPLFSALAVPANAVGTALDRALPDNWSKSLAGRSIERGRLQWGGDIHIYAVSFLNAFVTASLLAVYLLLALRLGYPPWPALSATFVLGLTTLLFAHSKNFMTHSLVALLLLASFAALSAGQNDRPRRRWLAGCLAGLMVLTRPVSIVATPWLAARVFFSTPSTTEGHRARIRRTLEFLAPLAIAVCGVLAWNKYCFGGYLEFAQKAEFTTQPLVGLYGHLFSVGRSIFLYSPALVLVIPVWGAFARRHRLESRLILGISTSYLAVYSMWWSWDGRFGFGNRFLLPLVPLGLLALPGLLQHLREKRRPAAVVAVALVLAAGLFVQVLGLSTNISFVYHHFGVLELEPRETQLFVPQVSQLATHWKALRQGLYIDFWVYRSVTGLGWARTLLVAMPWLLSLGAGLGILTVATRERKAAA